MKPLSIRDLQKMSEKAIRELPGPTTIRSGERAIGLLIPYRTPKPETVDKFLQVVQKARKRALSKGLDEKVEDGLLATFGPVEKLRMPGNAKPKAKEAARGKKRAAARNA